MVKVTNSSIMIWVEKKVPPLLHDTHFIFQLVTKRHCSYSRSERNVHLAANHRYQPGLGRSQLAFLREPDLNFPWVNSFWCWVYKMADMGGRGGHCIGIGYPSKTTRVEQGVYQTYLRVVYYHTEWIIPFVYNYNTCFVPHSLWMSVSGSRSQFF